MNVWFGLNLASYSHPQAGPESIFDRVVAQAQAAERVGLEVVTVMDHFYQVPSVGPVNEPILEAWTTLSALARETRQVRLGTLVTGVTYRNPALVAKLAATLDIISGGRVLLGLGAAWHELEHSAYGYDFPPVGERMDRLDEALTIIRMMLVDDRPTFHGKHYRITEAINVPRPIQPGGPRLLVGGAGEQRTLQIAARHADMTHWFPVGLETLRRKADILATYCDAYGRDPSSIERTISTPVLPVPSPAEAKRVSSLLPPDRRKHMMVGSLEQSATGLQPYLDAGFTGFLFPNTVYHTPDMIEQIGELHRLVTSEAEQPEI